MNTKATADAQNILWDLADLYQSLEDPKIESDLKTITEKTAKFVQTYKGKISTLSSEELKKAYQDIETLLTPLYAISQYAGLRFAIETDNSEIKAFNAKIDEFSSKISNEILFFDLELGQVDKKIIQPHLDSKVLKNYHYSLIRSVETAKYNLSEKEEQLSNLKDLTGKDALQKLYEELTFFIFVQLIIFKEPLILFKSLNIRFILIINNLLDRRLFKSRSKKLIFNFFL